ncbi:MAG: TIGR00282 family metallophosphoesterase [Patescibacteria group bacterium]
MNFLFIGDIVSRLGREAVESFLPKIKKSDSINLAVGNIENLANGRGATENTVQEILSYGIDYCTSGDHIFFREDFLNAMDKYPVLRPANYPGNMPGKGFGFIEREEKNVLLLNLLGVSVAGGNVDCPFRTADKIIAEHGERADYIFVDFHAENTSERRALGFYLDGRVTGVLGTHTHVPSADEQILPKGTAYVTDLGMCGPRDSVLGVKKEIIVERFKYPYRRRFEWVKEGPAVFNSVLINAEENCLATRIERVDHHQK